MTNISDIGAHDSYRTIAASGTSEYVDRKSRFIGQVQHVESEHEAREFIDAVRATYPDARHHVYAYVLRENNRVRYSDDGEPKKTAGLPALSVIEHLDLRDVVCVVTRYFGGTLLGTGGLVRAYTSAAQAAFADARIVSVILCDDILIAADYGTYELLRYELDQRGVQVISTEFAGDVTVTIRVRHEDSAATVAWVTELSQGKADVLVDEPAMLYNRGDDSQGGGVPWLLSSSTTCARSTRWARSKSPR